MSQYRVLIADDHSLVRAGIRALIETIDGVSVRHASSRQLREMSVQNGPAMIALTRTVGPNSIAGERVTMLSAPLAAAYTG